MDSVVGGGSKPSLTLTGDVTTFSKNNILLDLTIVGLETELKNLGMNDDSIQEYLDTIPFEKFSAFLMFRSNELRFIITS